MRKWRLRLVLACLSVLLWSGCATRRQTFRVVPIGGTSYLLPPDYRDNKDPGHEIVVKVSGVAKSTASKQASGCAIDVPQFSMARPRGGNVVVHVRPQDLFAGGGVVRAYRGTFDRFRTELSRLEQEGCLRPGGGRAVAERVAESLPLPVMETLFYSYGYEPFRGYCEVHPDMRIDAQKALLEPGPDGKEKLVRIDRALYAVRREEGGEGLRFQLDKRTGTEAALPGLVQLHKPFYRFFYHIKFNDLSGTPQRTAVLLGADSLQKLEQTTASLWKDPDLTCGRLTDIDCVKSPVGQIVTAQVPVRLNGKREVIPVSFTIGDVLRDHQAMRPGKPAPTFELQREYRGRLARVEFLTRQPVLNVPIRSGDRLKWK